MHRVLRKSLVGAHYGPVIDKIQAPEEQDEPRDAALLLLTREGPIQFDNKAARRVEEGIIRHLTGVVPRAVRECAASDPCASPLPSLDSAAFRHLRPAGRERNAHPSSQEVSRAN